MIKWRRARKDRTRPELDRQLAEAEKERSEVAALRPESERLERRMTQHLKQNHFAERLLAEAMHVRRGRSA